MPPKISKSFLAKYYGRCPLCDQKWTPNKDWLHYVDGILSHVECPVPGQAALQTTITKSEKSYYTSLPSVKVNTSNSDAEMEQLLADKQRKEGRNIPLPIEDHPIDPHGPTATMDFLDLAESIQSQIETETEAEQPKRDFNPSPYQQAIFDFISFGHGNAVVEAVAGSGKTTTIVKALDLTSANSKVAFLAFNKHIAAELSKRAPDHVHVSTLHSLGLSNLRRLNSKVEIKTDKVGEILDSFWEVSKEALQNGRIDKQQRKEHFQKRLQMRKLVSISKSVLCDVSNPNAVLAMIEHYNVDIDIEIMNELIDKLPAVMEQCKQREDIIDFDDMIWLPIASNMQLEKFDFLFVDEWQDMNLCNIEFILRSISETGRIIVVGDKNQSLYAFRGATPEAMDIAIEKLNATVLPLSVTYRCPSSHVELAKQLVPQLEARDNAPDGLIIEAFNYFDLAKTVQPGDMVICRTNAPLIKPAFECIRMGKKAVIRGKDIGESLVNLIERFETDDLGLFEISLSEYFEHEYQKKLDKGQEMQALELQDKVETLKFIMNECSTVTELKAKIKFLFNDLNTGVVFSSIHRAKGLEAEKVFILRPDLLPHPKASKDWEVQQEMNCKYVAETRSKNQLAFVVGGENV